MTIDILGVGNKSVTFQDQTKIQFLDLDDYYLIAKKIIATYAPTIRPGLVEEMLSNDDAIANVAHAIMMADWQYNGQGTLHGFRKSIATFAIRNYAHRSARTHKRKILSLDAKLQHANDDVDYYQTITDRSISPAEEAVKKELRCKIVELLNCGVISDQQALYLRQHYLEGLSMADIAEKRTPQVTRQSVHDLIKRALKELRTFIKQDPYFKRTIINES